MTAVNQPFGDETVVRRPFGRQGSRLSTSLASGWGACIAGLCLMLHLPMIIFFAMICAAAWVMRLRRR
jgi:hypothetical protein